MAKKANQKNKPFKSKHATKGAAKRAAQGRVETVKRSSVKSSNSAHADTKDARRNKAKQMLLKKRSDLVQQRRIGRKDGPPKIVAIISMGENVNTSKIRELLLQQQRTNNHDDENNNNNNGMKDMATNDNNNNNNNANTNTKQHVTFVLPAFKQRITLYETPRDLQAILDIGKVADLLLLVVPGQEGTDDEGEYYLSALRAQGLPSIIGVVTGLDAVAKKNKKHAAELRKQHHRYFASQFGTDAEPRVVEWNDKPEDAKQLARWISETKVRQLRWRDQHPYMLIDNWRFQKEHENNSSNHPQQQQQQQQENVVIGGSTSDGLNGFDASLKRGTLVVSGYLRGRGLSANHLVHLVNFGTFQIKKITEPRQDPYPLKPHNNNNNNSAANNDMTMGQDQHEDERVLSVPDPEKQEKLAAEIIPDPLANEQTWPTEEELMEAEASMMDADGDARIDNEGRIRKKKKVPKGYSAYQAAWIPSDDEDADEYFASDDEVDEIDEDEEEENKDGKKNKHRTSTTRDNKKKNKKKKNKKNADSDDDDDDDEDDDMMDEDEEYAYNDRPMNHADGRDNDDDLRFDDDDDDDEDNKTTATDAFDMMRDENMTEEEREAERQRVLNKAKESEEYAEFPDEVDTPLDEPARRRFARYRGLKSFRNSPWDPKESLPLDYARIFQFSDFAHSQKRALMKQSVEPAEPDLYVSVHIANVPEIFVERFDPSLPFLLFGLLRHEQKMSLLNLHVQRHHSYEEPVRSKDELFVQCGFRTFQCNPIFSEHNPRLDKFKFEKFLAPAGCYMVASLYAPVTFAPSPVLIFKREATVAGAGAGAGGSSNGKLRLVATGSNMGVNPDRIVLKRIILSGYPFKCHKRTAVVRYMFYNPDDVRWFRPVELWTKHGQRGVIREPVGTHGYMKCRFDQPLKQHDTVCMSLYKRVYPKWTTQHRSLLVPSTWLSSASSSFTINNNNNNTTGNGNGNGNGNGAGDNNNNNNKALNSYLNKNGAFANMMM